MTSLFDKANPFHIRNKLNPFKAYCCEQDDSYEMVAPEELKRLQERIVKLNKKQSKVKQFKSGEVIP